MPVLSLLANVLSMLLSVPQSISGGGPTAVPAPPIPITTSAAAYRP